MHLKVQHCTSLVFTYSAYEKYTTMRYPKDFGETSWIYKESCVENNFVSRGGTEPYTTSHWDPKLTTSEFFKFLCETVSNNDFKQIIRHLDKFHVLYYKTSLDDNVPKGHSKLEDILDTSKFTLRDSDVIPLAWALCDTSKLPDGRVYGKLYKIHSFVNGHGFAELLYDKLSRRFDMSHQNFFSLFPHNPIDSAHTYWLDRFEKWGFFALFDEIEDDEKFMKSELRWSDTFVDKYFGLLETYP